MSEIDEIEQNYIPVPKMFWSDLTGAPFEKCVMCETYLLEEGTPYVIEKAFKNYKGIKAVTTIFEYAMCVSCAEKMKSTLSASSQQKVQEHYAKNVNFHTRRKELEGNRNVEDWLSKCIMHKEEPSNNGEYQINALCDGQDLIFHDFPFMISGEAMDEIVGLLSQETLDELDNFKNKITSGPPELMELFESAGARVFV